MQVSRRGFLAGLIALPATALAAKLALPSTSMAEEVRGELIKDLNKTVVAMPGQIEPIWASVSVTADFWASELAKLLAKKVDRDVLSALEGNGALKKLPQMTRELARRIDDDLRTAKVPKEKQLIIGMPEVRVTNPESRFPRIEISAGLSKKDTIWGEEYRVEHIRDTQLIVPAGTKI